MTKLRRFKIEVGIQGHDETVWPMHYRTYADERDLTRAIKHVLSLASREEITSIRTTEVKP